MLPLWRIIENQGRGVKDKAFPGNKLPGFAAGGKDLINPNNFPVKSALDKEITEM
jgi:hypothetical protein